MAYLIEKEYGKVISDSEVEKESSRIVATVDSLQRLAEVSAQLLEDHPKATVTWLNNPGNSSNEDITPTQETSYDVQVAYTKVPGTESYSGESLNYGCLILFFSSSLKSKVQSSVDGETK